MKARRKLALGIAAIAAAVPIIWLAWWLRGTSPQRRRRSGRAR